MAFITNYDFTEEQNSHFFRQVLQFITSYKVPPTPINYAIIYEYITGSNKGLITAVDKLVADKKLLDNDMSINLYKKYIFDVSFESFDKINQNLQSLISNTRDTLAESSKKANKASISFKEQAVSAESIQNPDDLKKVITNIVNETKELADTSNQLKDELETANEEMEKLRTELATVREAAATDALTGLVNRGTFDQSLKKLFEDPETNETCLTLLDLDHFKQVNDTHGHIIGDNVLKFTAKLLKEHAEPNHVAARYGGEELAIIMPDTSLQKASEIAENIRAALEKSRLKKKNSSESIGQITVSIGISSIKPNDTPENLIIRADNALYQAKELGRNRVITES